MLNAIKADSPIENYPSRSGVKYNITVNRQMPNVPKAVREKAKYQPGSFARNWTTVTFDNKAKTTTIYGVRNRQYQLTHLLNFDHAHFSHGRITGEIKGSGFVDDVQNDGMKEFDSEIKRILNI